MWTDEVGGAWGVSMDTCYHTFPFQDGFEVVLRGDMSFEYLHRLSEVLKPAIDVLTVAVESSQVTHEVVASLLYMVAAQSRIEVVSAYQEELEDPLINREVMNGVLNEEWVEYIDNNGLMFVSYTESVSSMLKSSVSTLWYNYALKRMSLADDLLHAFSVSMVPVRVVAVGTWLVESDKGRLISELGPVDLCKPVLPRHVYADLLQCVSMLRKQFDGYVTPQQVRDYVEKCAFSTWSAERAADWVWMILSNSDSVRGYCYQLMMEPITRFSVCSLLGKNPLVSDVLWSLDNERVQWALGCRAKYSVHAGLHVEEPGDPDLEFLKMHAFRRIGAPSPVEPDYYARALVDAFIKKHRVEKPLPVVPPVDEAFGQLTLAPSWSGDRGFVNLSQHFYAKLGEPLSPRSSVNVPMASGLTTSDEYVSEIDNDRVRALHERLSDGAVIDETYYERTRKRFLRSVQRPRLHASEGRCYHVFAGFPADGGGTTDCWVADTQWDIPGWNSYVAKFSNEQRTVNFVASEMATDIRIDCTGTGIIELGSCRVSIDGSVLWFSHSIKLQVSTKGNVALRVTVPQSGSAIAVGKDIRRYMNIPGYSVVVRSFDIVNSNADVVLLLDKNDVNQYAGCQVRHGNKRVERGRHRFKVSGLASEAPVKLIIKTDPSDALDSFTVSGMRLKMRTREYITVLYDTRNTSMYLSLCDDAIVYVSVLQVVNFKEFDIEVAALQMSKTGNN